MGPSWLTIIDGKGWISHRPASQEVTKVPCNDPAHEGDTLGSELGGMVLDRK